MDRHEFNRQLAEAAREMADESGTSNTLDRAVQMATEMVENCDVAGISVLTRDGVETPSASGEELRRIDELQYELGQGPCFDALRENEVVFSPNLGEDDRWPQWGKQIAEEIGIHSSLSFRLFTTGGNLGALDLYSRKLDGFTHEDLLEGSIVAAHAAAALAASLREEDLRSGLETRSLIGQAMGIVMERFGIDGDRAFSLLQRISSHTNTKLHVVAQQIVETRSLPGS